MCGKPKSPADLERHECVQFLLPRTGAPVPWLISEDGVPREIATRGQLSCAGDILGALTGDAGLPASAIGRIAIHPTRSYVAIAREQAARALKQLEAGKIKGRRFRVRPL